MLSALSLSLIVFLSTFLDYVGIAFFPSVILFRCIGRLAFPLCCYLIAVKIRQDGFAWPLFFSLFVLALISEIPFDQLRFSRFTLWNEQNPVFSLLICTLLCGIIQTESFSHACKIIYALILIILSMVCSVSYGWLGPALSTGFLLTCNSPRRSALVVLILPLVYALTFFPSGIDADWYLQIFCISLAAIPILLFQHLSFERKLPFLFLALSYPLQMLFLIWIRDIHLIPPYLFE